VNKIKHHSKKKIIFSSISGQLVVQVRFSRIFVNKLFVFLEIDDEESEPSIKFVTYILVAAGFNDQTTPYAEQNGLVKEQQVVFGIIICKCLSLLFYFRT